LEEDKEVKEILEEAHKKIVISKLIQNEIEEKATVSDKEVRNYYDTHGDEFATQERMKVSHILVNSEKEAKTILTELANGASFEELAKEKSEDTSSDKGGDIGYFTKGQVVPEFEKAASKLEIGQISEIVKSEFGYHIIKLTDKKPAQTQDFTGVSNKIKSKLLADKKKEEFDKLADRLKAGVAININKELLEKKEETSLMSQRKAPMPKKETLEVAKEKEVVGEVKTNE
ncbi:MAG: peptidylprolyl isomerase, partial [Candidatus Omnitrophica bacterium]|nr:peptidylprolyl isomerase [Candidatus Omnitrophota bacterium]